MSKKKFLPTTDAERAASRMKLFMKYVERYWEEPLDVRAKPAELAGVRGHIPFNARQLLGIDIYQSQVLLKQLEIDTLEYLYNRYSTQRSLVESAFGKVFKRKQKNEVIKVLQKIDHCFSADANFKKRLLRLADDGTVKPRKKKRKHRRKSFLKKQREEAEAAAKIAAAREAALKAEEDEKRFGAEKRAKENARLWAAEVANENAEDDPFIETKRDDPMRDVAKVPNYLIRCREARTTPFMRVFETLEVREDTLDLSHFAIGIDNCKTLCETLSEESTNNYKDNQSLLKALNLADNSLNSRAGSTLGKMLGNNSIPSLRVLILNENKLSHGLADLFAGLEQNTSLCELHLRRTKCSRHSMTALSRALAETKETLAKRKQMEDLCLQSEESKNQEDTNFQQENPAIPTKIILGCRHVLTFLDLSYNDLEDDSGVLLATSLRSNKCLQCLNIEWNKFTFVTARELRQMLRENVSLRELYIGWNSLGDDGAASFAEALAEGCELSVLDLSQNRITYPGALLLSQGLPHAPRLQTFALNFNPIGIFGAHLILAAAQQNDCIIDDIQLRRVEAPPYKQQLPTTLHMFEPTRLSGLYVLNLEKGWDHAVAELLRCKAAHKPSLGYWFSCRLDVMPLPGMRAEKLRKWQVPWSGKLQFEYVSSGRVFVESDKNLKKNEESPSGTPRASTNRATSSSSTSARASRLGTGRSRREKVVPIIKPMSSIHYKLDLANETERAIFKELLRAARQQEGENWIGETYNGEIFDFDEDLPMGEHWIEKKEDGIVELDFFSTRMKHERQEKYLLSDPMQRAKASGLLERVYLSSHGNGSDDSEDKGSDEWRNVKIDGVPCDLQDFRHVISDTVAESRTTSASPSPSTNATPRTKLTPRQQQRSKSPPRTPRTSRTTTSDVETPRNTGGGVSKTATPRRSGLSVLSKEATPRTKTGTPRSGRVTTQTTVVNDVSGSKSRLHQLQQENRETPQTVTTWKLPEEGLLTFELFTKNPVHVLSDSYTLDLSNRDDRSLAETLRLEAALWPGQNWWNETLDGVPFDLDEDFAIDGEHLKNEGANFSPVFPKEGILEFDFVVLHPKHEAKHMINEDFTFDLSIPDQFSLAHLLHRRVVNQTEQKNKTNDQNNQRKGSPASPSRKNKKKKSPRKSPKKSPKKSPRKKSPRSPRRGSGTLNKKKRGKKSKTKEEKIIESFPKEYWRNVRIGERMIPSTQASSSHWRLPQKGILKFVYCTMSRGGENGIVPARQIQMLARALREMRSDWEKLQLVAAFALDSDTISTNNRNGMTIPFGPPGMGTKFEKVNEKKEEKTKAPVEDAENVSAFQIHQVELILQHFYFGTDEQRAAMELLVERLAAPHQALRLLPLLKTEHGEALKIWVLSGTWPNYKTLRESRIEINKKLATAPVEKGGKEKEQENLKKFNPKSLSISTKGEAGPPSDIPPDAVIKLNGENEHRPLKNQRKSSFSKKATHSKKKKKSPRKSGTKSPRKSFSKSKSKSPRNRRHSPKHR
eukprot:g2588.t1